MRNHATVRVQVAETGKEKVEDPGDLAHPFMSKLKSTGGGLSPRSRRMAEMDKENSSGKGSELASVANKIAPPAPAAAAAPPPPAPPPAAAAPAPLAPPAAAVNVGASWSEDSAAELRRAVEGGGQAQHKDAVTVLKRWAGAGGSRVELSTNADVFSTLATICMSDYTHERAAALLVISEVGVHRVHARAHTMTVDVICRCTCPACDSKVRTRVPRATLQRLHPNP